jgi:hypothetical protein
VGSRAPIRGPLPLLGSATGSQGSPRRMSHEKTPLTSSQCNAHNSTELLELAAKRLRTKTYSYISLYTLEGTPHLEIGVRNRLQPALQPALQCPNVAPRGNHFSSS